MANLLLLLLGLSQLDQSTTTVQAFTPSTRTITGTPFLQRKSPASSTARMAFDIATSVDDIGSFLHSQPYVSAFLTCSVQNSAADLLSQQQQLLSEQEENETEMESFFGPTIPSTTSASGAVGMEAALQEQLSSLSLSSSSPSWSMPSFNGIDMKRNLCFLLYGGFYGGLWNNYVYNTLFPTWFGQDPSIQTVVREVATDMFVLTPFLCLPTLYLIKAVLEQRGFADAMGRYKHSVMEDNLLLKNWAVWLPVQSINFALIPADMRIPFNAAVSFVWMIALSSIASNAENESD